ncbi:MAG: hypothetical protein ACHP83_13750, partial [Burkholderiales bacterium]
RDMVAFALLRLAFDADAVLFHSAWFMLSVLTQLAALLILRTRGPAWRDITKRWFFGGRPPRAA